ncbi:hypothetical protein AB0929_28010 [Streptomyces massasporeus]|uniref:hypothetical protein n=1 Tax=Streptomyces massasporeus TaxID=67324 RepID=UPI0034555FD9
MTARRILGTGPQSAHNIRAAQADLLDALPGVRILDLDELQDRGLFGVRTTALRGPRRAFGPGGRPADDPSASLG